MFSKDKDINITIKFYFKISCKREKFPYSFSILLTQWHEFPAPKLTNFIFLSSLSL